MTTAGDTFTMLTLDSRRLLLPQGDIRTLEPLADMDTDSPPENGQGWIRFEEAQCPVYCLSGDLGVLGAVPPARRICAVLTGDDGHFGLLCDDLLSLYGRQIVLCPLPACMTKSRSPLKALALQGDEVGLVSDAVRLKAFFSNFTRESIDRG